ncbi:MAG: prolyl oligopeptidase family serine peptidase [Pseudonocardiaceae bacterium]
MAGVDHALELGLADSDRLGVFGVSGGGTLTGWIIGHTDRFKAACPENPLFNFLASTAPATSASMSATTAWAVHRTNVPRSTTAAHRSLRPTGAPDTVSPT